MDDVMTLIGRDQFAKLAGVELLEAKPGFARARMTLGPQHMNGIGIAQGGAIFTLADVAFGAACNAGNPPTVALQVSVTFLKAAPGGTLTAEARALGTPRKVGSYDVRVTDEAGDLVASFQGLAYRKAVAPGT